MDNQDVLQHAEQPLEQGEQVEEEPQINKKKELSQRQIDHLNTIRVKALERKREIKLKKHEEYKKQAMEKKVQQVEIKPEVKPEVKQEVKQEIKQEVKQEESKKKKVLKKIIKYVEADEDEEDEEEVIITKPKKKEQVEQKQPEISYNDLLYNSSLERMQMKMMNERAKNIIYSVIPNYY